MATNKPFHFASRRFCASVRHGKYKYDYRCHSRAGYNFEIKFSPHKKTAPLGLFFLIKNAILVSGQNTLPHIKISFTDANVLEFIKGWIYLHSINPVDQLSFKEICLYDDIDKSVSIFMRSVNPHILKDEKDWFGNLIVENVCSIEYGSSNQHKHHSADSIIVSQVIIWKRDRKISEIIG